jgi:hypothetical protein
VRKTARWTARWMAQLLLLGGFGLGLPACASTYTQKQVDSTELQTIEDESARKADERKGEEAGAVDRETQDEDTGWTVDDSDR